MKKRVLFGIAMIALTLFVFSPCVAAPDNPCKHPTELVSASAIDYAVAVKANIAFASYEVSRIESANSPVDAPTGIGLSPAMTNVNRITYIKEGYVDHRLVRRQNDMYNYANLAQLGSLGNPRIVRICTCTQDKC